MASTRATAPRPVPCPLAYVRSPSARPTHPVPPPRDPNRPVIGGPALATSGLIVPPGAPPLPKDLSATFWLVADMDTGAVLGACGPHEQSPPASVQKLLLTATVLPKLDPNQVVHVTREDLHIDPGSSAVGLVVGGRYTVADLMYGLLLESGNDAANALARVAGGAQGVAGTVAAMNALAKHLGALDTHADTPSGLDGPGQFTSAYDLALIGRACFAIANFRTYDDALTAQMPAQPGKGKSFQIQNENKLLKFYPGALGGKTGFTTVARQTYVGAAERGGRRLVVTLLNGEARPARIYRQGASLLDWGFAVARDASVGRLVNPGETDATAAPSAAAQHRVPVRAAAGPPVPTIGVFTVAAGVAVVLAVPVTVLRLRRKRRRAAARYRVAAVPRPRGPQRYEDGYADASHPERGYPERGYPDSPWPRPGPPNPGPPGRRQRW